MYDCLPFYLHLKTQSTWKWIWLITSTFTYYVNFVFPISVLVFLGMMSIPLLPHSSWLFSHFPALFFNQHKYLLVPAAMTSQHLLCHLYKALLYVHDIELVEIGVWWTMSVCFFFHPTRPKHREIKMEKKKKKNVNFVAHMSIKKVFWAVWGIF